MGGELGLNSVTSSNIQSKPTYNIGLVDTWQEFTQDIDGDGRPESSHGQLSEKFFMNNDKANYKITQKDSQLEPCHSIFNDLADDKSIDAVYINFAQENYEKTRERLSQKYPDRDFSGLNSQTLSNYKEEIQSLMSAKEKEAFLKLTNSGKKIFASAGNRANQFSRFALFDNVITIGSYVAESMSGSESEDPNRKFYSSYKEIDAYTNDTFESKQILDSNGKVLGYDVNGDNEVDYPANRTTSFGKANGNLLIGISFGGPKYVSENLPEMMKKNPFTSSEK